MQFDRVDQTLLELLQRDGRMSAQALSEVVNLSARATLNRVRRLEEDGLIEGYRAMLHRAAIGDHVSVFAEIALKDQRQATVQRFEQRRGRVVGKHEARGPLPAGSASARRRRAKRAVDDRVGEPADAVDQGQG